MRVQLLWIVAVWASCTAFRGTAYSRYESQLPNTPPNHPAVGHKNLNSGGSLNKFGSDFKAAGHKWTIALCQADSDGDGQSNGLELGDPYCVWSVGKKPTRTTQISDPSLSSSTTTAVATPTPPTTKAPPGATPRPSTAAPRVPTAVPSTLAPISNTGFQAAGTGSLSLFRGISMNWTYFEPFGSRRSADDFLEVSFSVASDEWVGFGPSPSAMQGNQVICVVRADGTGACADIQTDGAYGVSDRTPVTQVVSTERNAAGYQMTVRTPAASLGGDLKSLQRAIFSKGAWDPSIDYPLQHASGDYFAQKVNFYTGAVLSAARSHYDWFVLLAAVGCVLLSCVVAAVLHARGFIPTPRQSRLLWLAAYATLALLVVAVFIVSAIGYRKDGVNAPWGRALGAAVTFLFFLILWPTTRYIGASHILGISYDKLLPLHVVVGTAIALIMTGHFGWMAVVYAKNGQAALRHQLLGWNTSSTVKPLAGFICWVAMMLMFLPAAALRRVAFGVFKLSHMLFPIVLLFGALHYTPMWIAIAPGLLGYGVELVFRLVHYLKPKQLDNAVFHADARVTELGLRLPPEVAVGPGQYVLVGFSELGPLLHPFSVAAHRDGIARCFVKSSGRWTNRLGEIVASNESLGQVRVLGPFGSLDVPLDRPSRIVCVSGGIGVTPMISILQHLASGPYKAPVAVKFIWVTPNMELVAVLGPIIQEQLVRLRGFATIEAVVHVTRLETTAKPPTEVGRSNNREGRLPAWQFTFRCEAGRPNLMQYFSEYEGGDPKAVAAYVCGPAALTESVRALSHYLDINLHTETFEY